MHDDSPEKLRFAFAMFNTIDTLCDISMSIY